ncbi:MAG TPA: BTAD domain-containing putative transcriptional regulator [Burkholderiales bacterium]|nr:BTAD domain-containing putative transcriptional regulator [Burkholderiales bacterium]
MARRRPQIAKLSRPRLHAPVRRDRLFKLLDGLRDSPVVWIEGPPGAGKTTTIGTYVDAARAPCVWYQVDGGDADAGTFFHYLHEAVPALGAGKWRLPVFSSEHYDDPRAFARRFFRALFQRLPPGVILVFDNYQEIADDSSVHDVLACAAGEVPAGANIFAVSRTGPAKAFARARASGGVAVMDWNALRLSVEEVAAIAASRSKLPLAEPEALHRESNGWAAGVVLMLEQWNRAAMTDTPPRATSREATFDYFASQIFDSALPEAREVMMRTALFPIVGTGLAEAITGDPNAARVLDALYRRRLFVDRRSNPGATYQYHALFRAFLRHQAESAYAPEHYRQLLERAAGLLREHGEDDDAFALYCEAKSWRSATVLLCSLAPALIGQGRLQALQDRIGALPESNRRDDPDLCYWMGMALLPTRPNQALPWLSRAYDQYVARGNALGSLLSNAGVLDAIFLDYSDFTSMRHWVALLGRSLEQAPNFPSPEAELRAMLSLLGIVHIVTDNSLLPACAARVETLLAEPFDVNLKVMAGQRLVAYADAASDLAMCRRVAGMTMPLLDSPQLAPAIAASFLSIWGYNLYIAWRLDESLECLDRVRSISQREGLHDEAFRATVYRALCLRRAGQLEACEATVAELESLPKPVRGARASMAEILKALVAYSRGRLDLAIEIGSIAQRTVDDSGNTFNSVVYRAINADILITAGKLDLAERSLEEARALASGTVIDLLRAYIALNQAHAAHLRGNPARRSEYLKEALACAREEGARARLRWFPRALAALLPIALREGIEPDVARGLVRDCALEASDPANPDWPWQIKINMLGSFEIRVEDSRITFDRKPPRKTLALLQALIAFGAEDVPEEKLLEALWPDDEADAAHRAFTQALYRLRKILGDNAVLRQAAGKLSLDTRRCWVDAFAFSRSLGAGDEAGLQAAVALYGGLFLKNEESPSWVIPARERLRAGFVDAVGKLAAGKERDRDFYGAIEIYRRGLAADDLVEAFYQGLMRCYQQLDRQSDALRIYRRLRETLSVVLGIKPSAASEKIYRQIQPG